MGSCIKSTNSKRDTGLGKVLKDKYLDLLEQHYNLTPNTSSDRTDNLKWLYVCFNKSKRRTLPYMLNNKNRQQSKQQAPKTFRKEVLVIKAEGRIYTDLLRVVKSWKARSVS